MDGMSIVMPFVVVILALVAAGSIAYIAWELTSEEFHASFDDQSDKTENGDD